MDYSEFEIKRLKYIECNNHQGELLNLICLEEKCEEKGLICPCCEVEMHQQHQTIPFKLFIKDIRELNKSHLNKKKNFDNLINVIEQFKQKCHQALKTQYDHFIEVFKDIDQKIDNYYQKLIGKVQLLNMGETNTQIVIDEFIQGKYYDPNKLLKDINQILNQIKYDTENNILPADNLQNVINLCQERELQVQTTLAEMKNMFEQKLALIDKNLKDIQIDITSYQISKFKFSTTMRAKNIQIINEIQAKQSSNESNGQRFILMEPSLSNNKKTVWGIKGWVGIGICHQQLLNSFDYKFNYTKVGHGSYLISTNGYSWSHLKAELNSAYKSFQFTAGDTVHCEYDPKKKILKFNKNESVAVTDRFELQIDDTSDQKALCVNLCSIDDTVEIINNPKYKFTW